MTRAQQWERFKRFYTEFPGIGLAIDLSRMNLEEDYFEAMRPRMQEAFKSMTALEKGAIANPDENRMVGHYWLRNASLAPAPQLTQEIEETLRGIKSFAAEVHNGGIQGLGGPFRNLLVIGIGGSALGPQFVANALGHPLTDKLTVSFFDNTDPDGMERVLCGLREELAQTLCIVISKSGGTKETRNGMLEASAAFAKAGLKFGSHAVAVTGVGSELDKFANENKWLRRFPMWDWVGGRTSVLSAVGLLPAALQGLDIDSMLAGAKACDEVTRQPVLERNPSALLALAWHYACKGRGAKDMVILPYKDRLELFSRYLQQLVMESIGKEMDLDGKIVNQGIAVYGNKGSTDQHAYVQQLRDGINNFFVTFIEVLKDGSGDSILVEPNVTSGDFLHGFLLGTRQALHEKDRESITITISDVSPFAVGVLIALYERTVGFYASLVKINAYHLPGVEAGKHAAGAVLACEIKILELLRKRSEGSLTCEQIATEIAASEEIETVFKICERLAANPNRGIRKTSGSNPFSGRYQKS
ncbi:MAG: glucose-6-phosphate isomerase [Verrucomicrobia bacterium]|nr:glucose-6-phosphate isomerase [Verrucomicrobiota bacterium]